MPALTAPTAPGRRLRLLATGLLIVMAALFAGATWATSAIHPAFAWVAAFAEAALVGGLADWFAVTALFRHPMGLPIPHTAIIPRSKDRIGDALARFLRTNFLNARTVARRLDRFSASAALGGWLGRSGTEARLREGVARLLRQLAASPAGAALLAQLHAAAMRRAADVAVAPVVGRLLATLIDEGRQRPAIDYLIGWTGRLLDSQEQLIRTMIEQRTAWLLRLLKLDDRLADAILAGLRGLVAELAADPEHPVRRQADAALAALAADLQHDGAMAARVESAKRRLLRHPAVDRWVEGMWGEMRRLGLDWLEGPAMGQMALALGDVFASDPALARAFDQLVRRAIVGVAADHGDTLVRLVSDTVRSWDTQTVTDRLEQAVAPDLQYIRFNGTLIGGLIGLGLHALLALG